MNRNGLIVALCLLNFVILQKLEIDSTIISFDSQASIENDEKITIGDYVNEVDMELEDFRQRNKLFLIISIFALYAWVILKNVKVCISNKSRPGYLNISSNDESIEMENVESNIYNN